MPTLIQLFVKSGNVSEKNKSINVIADYGNRTIGIKVLAKQLDINCL